jgi:hypothetical protein
MTKVKLARLSILAFALVGALSCSPARYSPKSNEEFYGTWISELSHPQKVVILADGTYEDYLWPTDETPFVKGTYEIKSKTVEADGTIWYRNLLIPTNTHYRGRKSLELCKITQAGRQLESITDDVAAYDVNLFPKAIDPKSIWYKAYKKVD